jgi:hypothetical protein
VLGAVASGTGGAGVCGGVTDRFGYSSGSNRIPSALKVSIDSPTAIVREGRTERLSKRIGLSCDFESPRRTLIFVILSAAPPHFHPAYRTVGRSAMARPIYWYARAER